jgi:hypothetical protein
MLTNDPIDALFVAHDRGSRLRADASSERVRGVSRTRHAIALFLRRAADRLDRTALKRGALGHELVKER